MMTLSLRLSTHIALFVAISGPLSAQAPTSADTRMAAWAQHQELTAHSPFAGMQWTAMGPRINGGRVEAIAVPRGNSSTIYVGMAAGSVWKTVNNGLAWKAVFTHQSSFAVGDIAVAPSNEKVVWVGTGEAQPRHSGYAYPGTGVFKSVDAGATWQHMGLTDTHHIGKVIVDPRNADRVYVGALGHFWSPNADRGVFRTTDGGRHWSKVLFVNDSTGVVDMAMDPRDSNTLYAWAWQMPGGRHGGLYKTTDGGTTWRHITAGLPTGLIGRAGLDVAPSRPSVVYAYMDNQAPGSGTDRPTIGGEVYRSDDRGEHWHKVNRDDLYTVFGEFGWKFCDVRVSPTNPDEIFILGNRGMHSTDGGKTYRRIGEQVLRVLDSPGKALHLDQHEIWIDPANPDHILLGNDGGVFQSYDRGQTWLHLNNIPAVQFYFIAADTGAAPYRVYGGTQDNAAVYGPSDARVDDATADPWRYVYLDRWTGGDSYVTIPDPTDRRIVYYEHQNGDMLRMDITGTSVASGGPSSVTIMPRAPRGEAAYRFGWYTPFFISQFDPRTLYVGGNRVLKSTDRGDHWAPVSPDLSDSASGLRGTVPVGTITMLSESRFRAGQLYAGTEGGTIWRTTDDGQSWSRVSAALPKKWVSRVIASTHREGTVYAAFTGYRQDDCTAYLYVSDDSGTTWRSIAANLPAASINVIKEDPLHRDVLYVGTDLGVYVSRDRGTTWQSLSADLPTTAVHDLVVQAANRELLIATYGLGAWKLDLAPVLDLGAGTQDKMLALFQPRAVRLDYYPWETVPGDRRGRPVATFHYYGNAPEAISLVVKDSADRVVATLAATSVAGVNAIAWNLLDSNGREAVAGAYTIEVRSARASDRATFALLPR
jgi:photosystem II stability/assembly factor-like uncharacterized protein